MEWKPAEFLIALSADEPLSVPGFVGGGLGLRFALRGSPKGRRPPAWRLYHLGTGHLVATIEARESEAFAIGGEIAALTDWTFIGLDGWRNRDPGLPDKMRAIAWRYPKAVRLHGGEANRDAAAAIAARVFG